MRMNLFNRVALLAAFATAGAIGVSARLAPRDDASAFGHVVEMAMSENAATAASAAASLRAAGQAGLDALCDEHDRLMRETIAAPQLHVQPPQPLDERIIRLRRAIDAVAKQRDAYASRLFWHTDLDEAKALAAREGKPILSLRLLGNLDDDRSCANSRFFRSVLYANEHVSEWLRHNYVLHWESLRPVPQLTIDFGDGRRIERTITGNSIHYVLAPDGRIIDALPGLYGPQAFNAAIQQAEAIALNVMAMTDPAQQREFLDNYHRQATEFIAQTWISDLQQSGVSEAAIAAVLLAATPAAAPGAIPEARDAMPLAPTKARLEVSTLRAATPTPGELLRRAPQRVTGLDSLMNDELWAKVAALHAADAALDQGSVALIRSKMPALETAEEAQRRTRAKSVIEDPVVKAIGEFEQSVAIDTVRNEYLFHRVIHEWLLTDSASPMKVKSFNERVYAQLFLTPLDDPWMGLAPGDAYAALDGGGLICR